MLIDIRGVAAGGAQKFSGKVDLSALRIWGETPFSAPVGVEGELTLRHSRVEVRYALCYTLRSACARCLEDVPQGGELKFFHKVSESDEDGGRDDIIHAPGGILDMAQLAGADLLLNFTRPFLCKEDCRGLCPKCGVDQNSTRCGCTQADWRPQNEDY